MSQRIYPIGIQNFEKIRMDGYLYVDKTALIHQLVTTGSYYFLSRPAPLWKEFAHIHLRGLFSRCNNPLQIKQEFATFLYFIDCNRKNIPLNRSFLRYVDF